MCCHRSQWDDKCVFLPQYLAPEVLRKQPYDNTVDWWCLGSVLYEMLFGLVSHLRQSCLCCCYLQFMPLLRFYFTPQPPFYSRDTHEMYDNILHKPLAMRPGASSTAWSLLQGLLEKDGTHRLGSRKDFVSGTLRSSIPHTKVNLSFLFSKI